MYIDIIIPPLGLFLPLHYNTGQGKKQEKRRKTCRHDNCDCTIIYDGQVLRGKQNADGSRSKTWEELPNANAADYKAPSLSEEQGRAIEQRNLAQIRGLTNQANGGKIESDLGRFKEAIRSDERMSKDYYSALKTKFSHGSDDAMICSEAFAHMYEAQFDKTRYAEMQKYFPSALSKFESMIKGAAK